MQLPCDPLPEDVFDDREDPGTPLCPHCLAESDERWHFCPVCMAPLTWYASTAPYESIWAGAWILAKPFQTAWPRPLHAWGSTLAFGPDLAAIAFVAIWGGGQFWHAPGELTQLYESFGTPGNVAGSVLTFVSWVFTALIYVAFVARAWMNLGERGRVDPWADEAADEPAGDVPAAD